MELAVARQRGAPEGEESSRRDQKVAQLRSALAGSWREKEVVPAGDLAKISAHGGLVRGEVTLANDSPQLCSYLLGSVTAAGFHAAVVGWPELSLAHVCDTGDIRNVVAVPSPEAAGVQVVTMLAEGMDLVVYRGSARISRTAQAKIRGGRAAVLCVSAHVDGSASRLHAGVTGFSGIGRGAGRIREVHMRVRMQERGMLSTTDLVMEAS